MNLVTFVNEEFEDEKCLFDIENKRVVLKGDWYHDKIDGKIEGYIKALNDYCIYNNKVAREYIDSKHELFNYIGFYRE